MRVGKRRCDKRLAQRKLSSNQRSENRHLAEWRFSPLIRIVTVYPKICSVIVIGISTTSSRRCDQPPAVRAAPDRILPSSAYSVKKALLCCMRAPCQTRTENEACVLTHDLTHEQKKRGGNSGTKRIHGCGNPAAKPPKSSETVYKASLSNLHTHEATGSSPVVSTTRNPVVATATGFLFFPSTHKSTHLIFISAKSHRQMPALYKRQPLPSRPPSDAHRCPRYPYPGCVRWSSSSGPPASPC